VNLRRSFICVYVIIGGFQKNLIENKLCDEDEGDHPHPTVVKGGEGEKSNLLLALTKRFFADHRRSSVRIYISLP
jgi:hypothetical protein